MNKFVDYLDRKRKEGGKKKYNIEIVFFILERKRLFFSYSYKYEYIIIRIRF